MKIRMYMDVAPYAAHGQHLFASSNPHTGPLPDGWSRVAFDVDLPDKFFRAHDLVAPAVFAGDITPTNNPT